MPGSNSRRPGVDAALAHRGVRYRYLRMFAASAPSGEYASRADLRNYRAIPECFVTPFPSGEFLE